MENKPLPLYENPDVIDAYIGTEKFFPWYRNAFKRYDDGSGGIKLGWNWSWAGFFLNVWYLLYRKCYIPGIVWLIVLWPAMAFSKPWVILVILGLCGGFFPYYIYRRFRKVVAEAQNKYSSYKEQLGYIQAQGGVNRPLYYMGIAAVCIGITVFLIIFAFGNTTP